WGRREAAPSRRGGQHDDGGRPHTSDGEARRRRRKEAARTGRGGWKATARGGRTHPTATAEVDLDYPLVNQLHLPGMKEMRHANRKLKHCLDPSSHDEHKYPLFCSIDKNQFHYGVIIITRRKAPSLIFSMLLC
uniref:Uncharacterized protein n=1 Tax=Triticum urartu TaxID=4572 RepID=A0A8R7QVG5_TRIUA